MTVTPYTAKRTIGLITHFNGDLAVAAHDCRITLQSLGHYTDRRTSAVLAVLDRMLGLTPERQAIWIEKLTTIGATAPAEDR